MEAVLALVPKASKLSRHARLTVCPPVWRFLKKLEIGLPYDATIPLLGIHTEETITERDVHPNVHHSTVYNSQDTEAT